MEKFIHIKSRKAGLKPAAGVVVATIRALKMHGGVAKDALGAENLEAVEKGLPNLLKHLENMQDVYGLNAVVALNKFPTDTAAEIKLVEEKCKELGVNVRIADVWAQGGAGAEALAKEVVRLADEGSNHQYAYELEDTIVEKMEKLVQKVYGGDGVELTKEARNKIERLEELGFGNLPICMAKTQYSLSDDPTKIGRPSGFKIMIRDAKVSAGAGFIVLYTGDIMTMLGLPQEPAAFNIDVDKDGEITGLF